MQHMRLRFATRQGCSAQRLARPAEALQSVAKRARRRTMTTPDSRPQTAVEETASELIDSKISALGDWRGETLARMRRLIREADPDVVESVKWRKPSNPAGVPVWEHAGIVCTGEIYRAYVKLTFAQGASLPDPVALFNASLEGNTRRAIDIREGEVVNA